MRRALFLVGLSVLTAGCGARTGVAPPGEELRVDAGARDAGGRDAGGRDAGGRDAGRMDAGRPDAGPVDAGPPACIWGIASGPFDVFRESTGSFAAPIVIRRDGRTDFLATYLPAGGGGRRVEVHASQLIGATPTPPVRLPVGSPAGPASGADWAGMISVCVPDSDGTTYLRRFTPVPPYPASSSQPLGAFDRCLGSAASPTTMIVAFSRGGVSFVSAFGPGGGVPARRALRDSGRSDPVSVATVGDELAWAGPSDGFGQIEVGWIDGARVRSFDVSGFARIDGVPPTLAEWPFEPGALAILSGIGFARLRVVTRDGTVLLRREGLPGRMFALPMPALARAAGGLLVAQLDFGDLDPRGGLLRLSLIGRDGRARDLELPSIGVRRRFEESGAEIAAAGDTVTTVVHWSEVDGTEPRTRALLLACD